MKAMVIERFGGAEELHMKEMPVPHPGPNDVLIEIAYTAVNPVDWMIREGMMKDRMPHKFPLILGWDAAGTVDSKGNNVSAFKKGDKIFAYCRKSEVQWGTFSQYVCVDQSAVARIPKNLSFKEAASVPLAGLTAWQGLFDIAGLKNNDTALILAGAGGVGSFAIQFAKISGARVFTTASEEHHAYVRSIGADLVIDYSRENVVEAVKRQSPEGIDVVFDLVGSDEQGDNFLILKPGGRLVSTVNPPDQITAARHRVRASFMFVNPSGRQLEEIGGLIETGKVKIPHLEEYLLQDVGKALKQSETQHTEGKIVVKVK
jgi:NADPH2:quinone reductase